MMPTGKELAKAACPFLGRLYTEMDCQAFVENSLAKIGIRMDLKGSNAWYREVMNNGWVGSPEDCKRKFGCVPDGAFLFIHAYDGGEEARGYHDGLGNASHIGIKTGMTGQEMVDIAIAAGNSKAVNYNYGDGGIHSSSSREHVCTSKFQDKSINGGWNVVGVWTKLSYGNTVDAILNGADPDDPDDPEPEEFATVWAESGDTVNLRKTKSTSGTILTRVPIGSMVRSLEYDQDWSKIVYTDKTGTNWCGYMMTQFLKLESDSGDDETFVICIPGLSRSEAEELMKKYPGSWIENAVG